MRYIKGFVILLLAVSLHAQQELPPRTTRIELDSTILAEKRAILVRTPLGYAQTKQSYPVLYMSDGDTQFGHTVSTVEFLAREGRMPEMIVVGVINTDRTRDLTPTKAPMRTPDGREMSFPTAGGADRFASFLESEVMTRIEKDYRTTPFTIFAGHSFGGLFAMHLFATRPKTFDAYIAVSPTLVWDQKYPERMTAELLKKGKDTAPLFVSMGDEGEEAIKSFESLRRLLETKAKKGTWTAAYYGDEDHGSIVMRTHYDGLRKIFDGWQLRLDDSNGRSRDISLAVADEHYKSLSTRFGYKIETPEGLINQLGYRLIGANQLTEAIKVFRANAERYPESSNVYDSLGEALERQGNLAGAKASYARAFEIGSAVNDRATAIYKQNLDRVTTALLSQGEPSK